MSLKVHAANGLMKGKSYTLCFRIGLPVTSTKKLVTCWTCTNRLEDAARFYQAIGRLEERTKKPRASKRPSIYGLDGRVNV